MLKEINEESEVVKNILNLYTKNNKFYNNTVKENASKVIELYKDYKGNLGINDIENNFKEEDVNSIEINEYLVGRTCERGKI